MVGGDRERAVLAGLLGRIVDGEGDVALVTAEPGLGKTGIGWRVFQRLARDLVPDPSVVPG